MGANEKHEAAYYDGSGKDGEMGQMGRWEGNLPEEPEEPVKLPPVRPSDRTLRAQYEWELRNRAPKPMGWTAKIVGLLILVPFIGILWAWSANVVQSLMGW